MSSSDVNHLLTLIQKGAKSEVSSLLKRQPALASQTTPEGLSLPVCAAYNGQAEIGRLLLEAHPEPTVFDLSVYGEDHALEKRLHQAPEQANLYAPDGYTPLGLSAYFGHESTAELLLAKGAALHTTYQNAYRATALHSAVINRKQWVALLLLRHGADVNARQYNDLRSLHLATYRGLRNLVTVLLDFDAHVNAKTADGKTALDLARDVGYPEIYAQLLERGGRYGEELP